MWLSFPGSDDYMETLPSEMQPAHLQAMTYKLSVLKKIPGKAGREAWYKWNAMKNTGLTKLRSRLWEEEESVRIRLSQATSYVHVGNSIPYKVLQGGRTSLGPNLKRLYFWQLLKHVNYTHTHTHTHPQMSARGRNIDYLERLSA